MNVDDLYDADDGSDAARMWRYTTELERLLASGGLSPDTRARCLASLIDAISAEKFRSAVDSMERDAVEPFVSAAAHLGKGR